MRQHELKIILYLCFLSYRSDSKLKRNAHALYSDSEQQTSDVEEDYVVEAPKKTKSSTKTSYKESKSRASKKLSKYVYLSKIFLVLVILSNKVYRFLYDS